MPISVSYTHLDVYKRQALEHVMQALQEDNDALNREIIILGKRTEEKEREVENICINLLLSLIHI